MTEPDYYGGTVDYYEHTNHIPPYASAIYYPGGAGGTAANYYFAARGLCAIPSGSKTLPAGCTLNTDGTISYANPALTTPLAWTFHPRHAALAGLTVRPIDSLKIFADFQFGYNDRAFTQIFPRQFQSYKIHATYKPRLWATIDGAIDIHENRDNVSNVNALEHGRTYSFGTTLTRDPSFAFSLGYSYTDLHMQSYICMRDTGFGIAPMRPVRFSAAQMRSRLGATSFYSNKQHFAYGDVMWKPFVESQRPWLLRNICGGDTLFLNPRILGGT